MALGDALALVILLHRSEYSRRRKQQRLPSWLQNFHPSETDWGLIDTPGTHADMGAVGAVAGAWAPITHSGTPMPANRVLPAMSGNPIKAVAKSQKLPPHPVWKAMMTPNPLRRVAEASDVSTMPEIIMLLFRWRGGMGAVDGGVTAVADGDGDDCAALVDVAKSSAPARMA